jgi:hypothetical protein
MTQYLLSVVVDASVYDMPEEEAQESYAETGKFNDELKAEGSWVFAGGLGKPDEATTVDNTSGAVSVTDGPFVETKEFLGGFWIVEAADRDAVLKIAARASKACRAKVEIRTFDGA